MIPRKIESSPLTFGKISTLLASALLIVLTWTTSLPMWLRAMLALLIVCLGLFLVFGKLRGASVPKVLLDAVSFLLRPRRWVWGRGKRRTSLGSLYRPPVWRWRLVEMMPSGRAMVVIPIVAAAVMISAVVGIGLLRADASNAALGLIPTPTSAPTSTVRYVADNPTLPLGPILTPTSAPTFTSTPIPTSAPTFTSAPVPSYLEFPVQPGYLRLSVDTPSVVKLVFTGGPAGAYTRTLTLNDEVIMPLIPALHPTVTGVQVWSATTVRVEQHHYAPYQCPLARTWWVWMDLGLSGCSLIVYPHSEAKEANMVSPTSDVFSLKPGQRNRLPYQGTGLYEVWGGSQFCLEMWLTR